MKSTAWINIGLLAGTAPHLDGPVKGDALDHWYSVQNAWLIIKDEKVYRYGSMDQWPPEGEMIPDEIIDLHGGFIMPTFVDSHTHLVFAAWREHEFVDRIKGLSYEQIAANGGGILNSAERLKDMPMEQLEEQAWERLMQCVRWGTGAIEIKSGYGLSTDAEIKMLRVIRNLKEKSPIPIRSTFLGAHAFPRHFKENQEGYMQELLNEMLPRVADEGLAEYVDVFCDRGFFNPEQTGRILEAAAKYGLKPKIHANELGLTGGVQAGVAWNAISVDHLEHTGEDEIKALLNSRTMPVLLPSTAFFLGIPYPEARTMIKAGLPVCLASDYNPGSSPSGRMSFVMSLACLRMKMTPAEAFNAATINGAYALEWEKEYGSLSPGKFASFIYRSGKSSLDFIPYHFSEDVFDGVVIKGEVFHQHNFS